MSMDYAKWLLSKCRCYQAIMHTWRVPDFRTWSVAPRSLTNWTFALMVQVPLLYQLHPCWKYPVKLYAESEYMPTGEHKKWFQSCAEECNRCASQHRDKNTAFIHFEVIVVTVLHVNQRTCQLNISGKNVTAKTRDKLGETHTSRSPFPHFNTVVVRRWVHNLKVLLRTHDPKYESFHARTSWTRYVNQDFWNPLRIHKCHFMPTSFHLSWRSWQNTNIGQTWRVFISKWNLLLEKTRRTTLPNVRRSAEYYSW